MRNVAAALVTFAVVLAMLGVPRSSAGEPTSPLYEVIVNPANARTTLDRKFVEHAFLKKVTTWPGGVGIHPVDLASTSPVRRKFSAEVLDRTVGVVRTYWQQRIFAGRDLPPPEFDADADVVRYVLKYDGAIGYVSASANIGPCKVVTVAW
jgi:hypothetical protein